MRQKEDSREAVEKTVRDIKRKTRHHFGEEDKIAASKRRGMWMGGTPPIGYKVMNPSLW